MSLTVSRTTARYIQAGHPWVRRDRFTRGLEPLRAGDVVTLKDERGQALASALVDPSAEICARVFHRLPGKVFDPAAAVRRAWERRTALHADPTTTCYRIIHGEADFLPGLRAERYADVLVLEVRCAAIAPYVDTIAGTLVELMPEARVVIKDHRDDLRQAAVANRAWNGPYLDPETVVPIRELGVQLESRPFAGLATGVYPDQRATRAWLRPTVVGQRVLNLFAYTGAFSASLLQAGAANASDVDVAAPSLAVAVANAASNGVGDRHRIIQQDCRAFLSETKLDWDLIIVDPPTAAQGTGGWVVRRDYPELLRLAWSRLAPGGRLVACCNTIHGKPFPLASVIADLGGQPLAVPALGDDVPQVRGFPEGRPFQLIAATRSRVSSQGDLDRRG
jgi:23S rRNA (cytosine1962-C5)-methyltransferase